MRFSPLERRKKMKNRFSAFSFFLGYLKKHKASFLVLLVAIIGVVFSSLLPSLVLKSLLDDVLLSVPDSGNIDQGKMMIWSIFYFGSYFLIYGFTMLENVLVDHIGQKMISTLRYQMMEKSHRISSSFYRHNGTGVIVNRIMDDVYAIENLFTDGLISLMVSSLKIIAILVSVFVFSWVLGLLVLVFLPVVFFLTDKFKKDMLKKQSVLRKTKSMETNNLSESIDNIVTLENLSKKGYREKEFEALLVKEREQMRKVAFYDAVFSPIVMSLRALLISLVTLLVAFSINGFSGFAGLSAGTFAASITLISNIFEPVQQLGMEIQTMQEGISGIKRVEEFMNLGEINKKDVSLTADRILSDRKEEVLRIDDLVFHYDDGEEMIFDHADLVIKKGEKVGFVGRTGAGKTTLFYLILSILVPDSGRIEVNGYDTSLIPDLEKRRIFGYLEQGFKAIDGTVLDQITMKDGSITMDQVRSVMKEVFLDDYVTEKIKGGYQAEFKADLFSRGQLQLLSLARALVLNPPILLLDEISANLDSDTEKKVIEILSGQKEKTMVSISHRLLDQLGFTRIVSLKDGKLIED